MSVTNRITVSIQSFSEESLNHKRKAEETSSTLPDLEDKADRGMFFKFRDFFRLPDEQGDLNEESPLWSRLPLPLPPDSCPEVGSSSSSMSFYGSDITPLFYKKLPVLIGKGAYGSVSKGRDIRSGSPVARKEHAAGSLCDYKTAIQESEILARLERESVRHRLHLRAAFDEAPAQHTIITDLIPTGNIYANHLAPGAPLGKLKFEDILTIARQALEYLADLGRASIIHADLKPCNLTYELSCRYLTILDCGLSRQVHGEVINDLIQSSYYRAPEVNLRKGIDCTVDMWSVGCILYELFVGVPLFDVSDDRKNIMLSIAQHIHRIIEEIGIPPIEYLRKCKNAGHYFDKTGAYRIQNRAVNQSTWKFAIDEEGNKRDIPKDQVEMFKDLIGKMLRYENRIPREALNSPLFLQDIAVHLSPKFSSKDNIAIYLASAIDRYTNDPSRVPVPLPVNFFGNKTSSVTRTCVHVPRDPNNEYFVTVSGNGIDSIERYLLVEGSEIPCTLPEDSLKKIEEVIPDGSGLAGASLEENIPNFEVFSPCDIPLTPIYADELAAIAALDSAAVELLPSSH